MKQSLELNTNKISIFKIRNRYLIPATRSRFGFRRGTNRFRIRVKIRISSNIQLKQIYDWPTKKNNKRGFKIKVKTAF